jgi:uncharacterized protein involved in tolerance to divalent cations
MKEKILLIFCTVASEADARHMAQRLLSKKLAACCTFAGILPLLLRAGEDLKTLLLIKTMQKKYNQLEKDTDVTYLRVRKLLP